jgi:hypothetical protein
MFGKAIWSKLFIVLALVSFGAAQAQAQPKLHSSSQKYREKNATGAKGRAGGASLTARMLYAKDGTTELEATTGEFGSTTPPPGTFWKMQVSALDALGVVMSTTQYRDLDGLGGYFRQSYTNLWPGQPFQVQAHIRTGSKRNDTVTVTTSVQKRPDVAVATLVSPPMAPLNLPIKMFAVVSELNGNVGARTDCVLYVNDVEADRAAAIWVDSGDSVSCAFSPTFTQLGTNRLKVRALGVDPGDWDAANNVFEKDVLVSTLTPEFDAARAEALVYDVNNTSFLQEGRYFSSTSTGGDWQWIEKTDTDGDIWTYTAVAAVAPLAAPASVNVSLSDGVLGWSVERPLSGCEDYAIGQVNGRTIYTSVIGCGALVVQAGGFSGTVTYTSSLLTATFKVQSGKIIYDAPAQYVFNRVETQDVNGNLIFNGNNWTVDVQVVAPAASGGVFTFSKPLSFALGAPVTLGAENPRTCQTGTGVAYCEESSWKRVYRYGETTFIKQ